MLKSKIHRARITGADLHYEGSIEIDEALMEAAGILSNEQVHVLNLSTGSRAETYAIRGPKLGGAVVANGALARLVHPGDLVILLSFAWMDETEARQHRPSIVHVDDSNRMV
jgi:aspartate 1-decarboxylase